MSTPSARVLPSWRDGATRDAIIAFLDASESLPPEVKVAAFDNDGTLWCERPAYAQYLFFADELRAAAAADPSLADRAEYAAVLDGDHAAMGELGLARIAMALAELFDGMTPDEFTGRVRAFMDRAEHPTFGIPLRCAVYQPMLELIAELRSRGFAIFVVSGGGTEFVRAISNDLYGVPPDGVVGTLVEHELHRDEAGRPVLRRTARLAGGANEGVEKVVRIQSHLGRRPILAAGNTGGDREMLEWAAGGDGPTLALLVDHDDAEREFAYQGSAESFAEAEPITDVSARLGWTVVSMAADWDTVFPAADRPSSSVGCIGDVGHQERRTGQHDGDADGLGERFTDADSASPMDADIVTRESYCRAESDRAFSNALLLTGGVNRFFHFRQVTPLEQQTVVRMNKDTLYSAAIVDTSQGATLTVPEMPDGRYCSVMLVDNDHYSCGVIYTAGSHQLPQDTKYLGVLVRIQLLRPDDPADVALVNSLQDRFQVEAASADPFPALMWDIASLDELRSAYNAEFATYDLYPDGWMDVRGVADENTRHIGCAGAWGLFPNRDAVYINDNADLPSDGCYRATYEVPDNDAFWSITVYGGDGFMKTTNNILNSTNTTMNPDGTFTVHFGSVEACGEVPNRLDAPEGWNFLMRVYRPGQSVLDGTYQLPRPVVCT